MNGMKISILRWKFENGRDEIERYKCELVYVVKIVVSLLKK